MEELKELRERVARLERERWWLVSVIVIAVVSFLLIGAVSSRKAQVTDKVQTRELVIVDQKGNPRASLKVDNKGYPSLWLMDADGKPRAGLFVTSENLALQLYDAEGKPRIGLGIDNKGPRIGLWDAKGVPEAELSVHSKGEVSEASCFVLGSMFATEAHALKIHTPELVVTGGEKSQISLKGGSQGFLGVGPTIEVRDAKGKQRITLSVDDLVGPALTLYDTEEKMRAILSVSGSRTSDLLGGQQPGLTFYDAEGMPLVALDVSSVASRLTLVGPRVKGRAELRVISSMGPDLTLADTSGKERVWLKVNDKGPGLVLMDAAGEIRTILSSSTEKGPFLGFYDAWGNPIWGAP